MPVLPSHILNILWDDVYPRIVPFIWDHETNGASIDRSGNVPAIRVERFAYEDIRATGADENWGTLILMRAIDDLRAWATYNTPEYTQEFRDAVSLLRNYLWGPDDRTIDQQPAPNHVLFDLDIDGYTQRNEDPFSIRFIPGSGFDFVVSNEGLDLALPPNPRIIQSDTPVLNPVSSTQHGVSIWRVLNSTEFDPVNPGAASVDYPRLVNAGMGAEELKVYQYYSYRRVGNKPMLIPAQIRRVANYWQNTMGMDGVRARVAARASNSASSNPTAGIPPNIDVEPNAILNWLEVGDRYLNMMRFQLGDALFEQVGIHELRGLRGRALDQHMGGIRAELPERYERVPDDWLDNLAGSIDQFQADPGVTGSFVQEVNGHIDQILNVLDGQLDEESQEALADWRRGLDESVEQFGSLTNPGQQEVLDRARDILNQLLEIERPRVLLDRWLNERKCVGKFIMHIIHGPDEENFAQRWQEYIWEWPGSDVEMGISYHGYMQLNRGQRRWQLTGDIYSHILQEMPRVFAEIWREDQLAVGFNMHPNGRLYGNVYPQEARQIYMERIEAWIPEGSDMHFGLSRCPEVIITDRGFLIPIPPPPPQMDDMFNEWRTGEAVNPVFTDTHSFK